MRHTEILIQYTLTLLLFSILNCAQRTYGTYNFMWTPNYGSDLLYFEFRKHLKDQGEEHDKRHFPLYLKFINLYYPHVLCFHNMGTSSLILASCSTHIYSAFNFARVFKVKPQFLPLHIHRDPPSTPLSCAVVLV